MKFSEVVDQARALLQRTGKITYRVLKREFALDDESLEDLKEQFINAEEVAVDQDGKMLVWTGAAPEQKTGTQNIRALEPRPAPSDADSGTDTPRDPSLDAAERRQLTVMFCDLVGSTALSEQLDPEEYREVVRTYQDACTAVISRYEGHVAQHLGDGLLVYFGYPAAHEDDAQRAVRTGLEIVGVIPTLSFPRHVRLPQPLQVRIGIHTGPVVVGEIGRSERRETLALGETPNLAARVQGEAAPNTVVLSAATYRLAQGLFECQDLGPHTLKGISTPLPLYHVVSESGVQSRFEAAVRTGLTPLVGREEELRLLRRHWDRVKAGEGQVVLLSGEAGIGKSRLVQELKEYISAEGVTRIEFHCSPYHQNSALYPIIDHLQRLLQFAREDAPAVKLEKLQRTLSRYRFPQADTFPLLAALLSLPPPLGAPPLTGSAQKQKEKTQEALVAWLVEEAEKAAVYCAWEDLHWADPSTLEVLTLILDQTPTTRLMALLTFRPEFTSPWGNRSHLSQLTLSRLGRSQVEALIERVTGGKALSPEVVQQIVAKTDGVPLFVEELTKTVIESIGAIESVESIGARGRLGRSSIPLGIPATLQDALMARLDRLGMVKEVAQLGATIGREFSYELLVAVSRLDEERLQQGLQQLVKAELVYQQGLLPQAHYLFKHALIQDTAYQSLLKSTRQQLHQQIAQVLEGCFPETVETQPELVAHHYTEASLTGQAIPYWQRAGERATQRSANVEAITHFTKGLELLKTRPDTSARAQQELRLHLALGTPLIATKGWAAPEVGHVYARARALSKQLGETPQLFPVLVGLCAFYAVRGEFPTARELGEELLTLAQTVHDSALLLEAHAVLGATLFRMGELAVGRAHVEQGIALYTPQQHHSLAFLYGGVDPGVMCRSVAAVNLWFLGYPDQALKHIQEALTLAHALSHPHSLGFALSYAAWLHLHRREGQPTQERVEALMALAREQEFSLWLAIGTIFRGQALAAQGQEAAGSAQLRQGLDAFQATGAEVDRPLYLAWLAEAQGKVGQVAKGLNLLTEATAVMRKTENRSAEAELYRLQGTLTLQLQVEGHKPKVEEAEACFHKAIEIARKQQAKSLELRAVMSLSRLWQSQGKKEEARQMLAEIYGWFTEGFDTKDLQEAKALLEEIAERMSTSA